MGDEQVLGEQPVASDHAANRVVTVPNGFTILRLLGIPVFLWLLFGGHPHHRYHAAFLLGALGATDWVDGYLARHLHQVSAVGQVLDPLVDRLLLGVGVVAILIDGSVPAWLGVLVIAREALVAAAALALAAGGARRIDVRWAGKAGTFGLMVAFPLFLVAHSTAGWRHLATVAAWCCALPAVALSLYSAVSYVPLGRRALAEGRSARSPAVRGPRSAIEAAEDPQEAHS